MALVIRGAGRTSRRGGGHEDKFDDLGHRDEMKPGMLKLSHRPLRRRLCARLSVTFEIETAMSPNRSAGDDPFHVEKLQQ